MAGSIFAVVATVPNTRPAAVSAASASACNKPVRSGTATGPVDTEIATGEPGATFVAATGVWLSTCVAGSVLAVVVTRTVVSTLGAKWTRRRSFWTLVTFWVLFYAAFLGLMPS